MNHYNCRIRSRHSTQRLFTMFVNKMLELGVSVHTQYKISNGIYSLADLLAHLKVLPDEHVALYPPVTGISDETMFAMIQELKTILSAHALRLVAKYVYIASHGSPTGKMFVRTYM